MRKFFLLATFFSFAPVFLLLTVVYLYFLTSGSEVLGLLKHSQKRTVAFAALPSTANVFADTIQVGDARVEILRQFFTRYKSPLEPYAEEFVKTAEVYQLDFRLLPSIAMQESNLCLKSNPDSYNCWGFGVYGGKYKYFDNYPQAIATISKTLAEKYRNTHGLVTPEEIQKMYTPSSNGSWANGVSHFMSALQ